MVDMVEMGEIECRNHIRNQQLATLQIKEPISI